MAKYSKGAGEKVEKAIHEMKKGELQSGRNGKKVTSRKQAIAIGLSEARERGAKVPKKASKTGGKTKAAKKSTARKSVGKKAAPKKSSSKTTKRSSTKKSTGKKTATKRIR